MAVKSKRHGFISNVMFIPDSTTILLNPDTIDQFLGSTVLPAKNDIDGMFCLQSY